MTKNNSHNFYKAMLKVVWQFGPRGLSGECCENISLPEYFALDNVLENKDCSVQEVGDKIGFTISGATRIVNRLKDKGYIKKHRSKEDSRVCCVDITENGKELLNMIDNDYNNRIENFIKQYSEQQINEFTNMLTGLSKILE